MCSQNMCLNSCWTIGWASSYSLLYKEPILTQTSFLNTHCEAAVLHRINDYILMYLRIMSEVYWCECILIYNGLENWRVGLLKGCFWIKESHCSSRLENREKGCANNTSAFSSLMPDGMPFVCIVHKPTLVQSFYQFPMIFPYKNKLSWDPRNAAFVPILHLCSISNPS